VDYMGLIYGIVGGVGWGILGFARAKQKDSKTDFDTFQFGKTVAIGAVLGFYGAYVGMPIDMVATTSFALTATAIVDKLFNIVVGFFKK